MKLAALPLPALARRLAASGGVPESRARPLAARILAWSFDPAHDEAGPRWDEVGLAALDVPRWARGAVAQLDPRPSLRLVERAPAAEGTQRLLFSAADGAPVESVLIAGSRRTTLCISSQVGCARACRFCETGAMGLRRPLEVHEIVDQVRLARGVHRALGTLAPLTNVVFMGMGEPLDNLARVLDAIALLTEPRAFAFPPARITVSTVGVADKIGPFVAATSARLAVSLNAPDDERRRRIMPVNDRCDLASLRAALVAHLGQPGRVRRLLVEYVIFEGFNDAEADADLVAAFSAGLDARVNVIPANPGPDPGLRAPPAEVVERFRRRLAALGVPALTRHPKGRDVGGACGQLAAGKWKGALPIVRGA
jgi:23S rRNA (adenine2503-C2)-methyltransferase